MELVTALFGHLCGQARCFVADGVVLPVCQRCTGLYVGALLTGMWLLVGGAWRRGLPDLGVVCVHAGALIVALLGGLHVFDFGPAWRLMCGLWTGHVAMTWLVTGATQVRAWTRAASADEVAWSGRQTMAAWLAIAAPVAVAAALTTAPPASWSLWACVIVGGALLLAGVCLRAICVLIGAAKMAATVGCSTRRLGRQRTRLGVRE